MKFLLTLIPLLLAACASAPVQGPGKPAISAAELRNFRSFLTELKTDAATQGHNPKLIDDAFGPNPMPILSAPAAEKKQPEHVRTFAEYVGSMLSAQRIATGREKAAAHRTTLAQIQAQTGVSATAVVALWGIETSYGVRQGDLPLIPALATLAWKSPRAAYFRKELMNALTLSEKTNIPVTQLKGSWAGAMGQCQFMPSSYLSYAKDGDGDGVADIWKNEDDVLASAANYLKVRGWQPGLPWKTDVTTAPSLRGISVNERGLSEPLPLAEWHKRGLKTASAVSAPATTPFRLYIPQGQGPSYLMGPNFDVILKWNTSSYFAFSALSLADALATPAP